MAMFTVEYAYADAPHLRDMHRPAHRTYLAGLADVGDVIAYGRFDDGSAPGAMLLLDVADQSEAERVVARDPYVIHGVVLSHRCRSWATTWGPRAAALVAAGEN